MPGREGWSRRGSPGTSFGLLTSALGITPVAADEGDKWEPEVPPWHSRHVTRAAGIATARLSSLLQVQQHQEWQQIPTAQPAHARLWGTGLRAEGTRLSLCNVAHFRFAAHKQQIPPWLLGYQISFLPKGKAGPVHL